MCGGVAGEVRGARLGRDLLACLIRGQMLGSHRSCKPGTTWVLGTSLWCELDKGACAKWDGETSQELGPSRAVEAVGGEARSVE